MIELSKKYKLNINIPNTITFIRILLVPFFIFCIIKNMYFEALIIFTVAGISDGLDGFIARSFKQQTVLGSYIDPFADKLLVTSAFIALSVANVIPIWLSVIVISRDITIVTGYFILTVKNIPCLISPSFIGKITTFFQLFSIFLSLFIKEIDLISKNNFLIFLFLTTAFFSIFSGLNYVFTGINILKNHQKPISATGKDKK